MKLLDVVKAIKAALELGQTPKLPVIANEQRDLGWKRYETTSALHDPAICVSRRSSRTSIVTASCTKVSSSSRNSSRTQ